MKILVVSLLRLGDLIMAAQTVVALKRKYPNAEIHLLTNRSNHAIAKILSVFDRVHYFERSQCQKSIGDIQRSVFEATDRVEDLVARLNKFEFDKLINLTQNRISAHLCGMIKADDYHGMITSETGVTHLSSAWFRHLNNYIAGQGDNAFHYIDLFRFAMGFEEKWSHSDIFCSSDKEALPEHKNKILIQAWTSDVKKDYPTSAWKKFFEHIKLIKPGLEFAVLAAPNEKDRLDQFIASVQTETVSIAPAILTFEELINYMPRQNALISVDTSVKHFAAALGLKTIELALGSSNADKTGVYSEGALLIKSRVKCSPCSHIKSCVQESFLCQESIDPNMLAMAVNEYIKGNWPSLRVLAEEFRDNAYIGRVGITRTGIWHTQSLHPIEWQAEKESLINLESWKFTLSRKHLQLTPPFEEVANALSSTLMDPQRLMTERLESVSRQNEMNVDKVSRQLHESIKGLANGDKLDQREMCIQLRALEKDMGLGDYLSQYIESLPEKGLLSLRGLREAINELRNYQVAKTNILRSLHKAGQGREL